MSTMDDTTCVAIVWPLVLLSFILTFVQIHSLFNDLYLSYLFNRDDLSAHCDKLFASDMKSSSLTLRDVFHTFFPGLAAYRCTECYLMFHSLFFFLMSLIILQYLPHVTIVYRQTTNPVWLERGRKCKKDMKLWTTQGSIWNFEGKWLLLEAEDHYSMGKIDYSRNLYIKSITSCSAHKYLNDEALAHELAGNFHFHNNEYSTAIEHFTLARGKYLAWGATKKADDVNVFVRDKLSGYSDEG